jgi:DNA-binding SARP family transcriptional activator/ABC-type glycerol-3-phosphate transport system substrate-binding protein/tRNA A-37 threonylcarbamoyl transferase component Bud32
LEVWLSARGVQFNVLGPLEFRRAGQTVDLGSHKQKSLLALLLIHRNQVVSTDRILDELWGEGGADKQNALWVHVSNLRSALEPDRPARVEGTLLLTRAPGYLLQLDPEEVDVASFERLLAEGRGLASHDPSAASLVFAEALSMWRGRALDDFTYESFAQAEIHRLDSLRLDAVAGRVEADLARGLTHQLVGELEGLVRENPYREQLTALLMTALYRSRRQAEALRAYGQLRERLGSELGIEPSADLRDLEEQILTGDPRLEPVPGRRNEGGTDPGLAVRGYELRTSLGKTRYGNVYRAYQPAIGREVAVKVIRAEVANDPAFVRRFEAETRSIAELDSPQVVPIFDFWREPDGAILVEKLITGGSLRSLLAGGPVPPDRVCEIVGRLAHPLARAHELGIVHGGLTLDNVLLDNDGRPLITDFGMNAGPSSTPADDIEALATSAAQLLAGSDEAMSELTTRIDPGLGAVTADPRRYGTVEQFAEAFRSAAGATPLGEVALADVPNPYKGLVPFDEADTAQFFGRERLVERMLTRLGGPDPLNRFLAVVGPSGSGKSSVVHAGLIPALRAGGVPGSDSWFMATMTPGAHPFDSLERALTSVAVSMPPTLLEQLVAQPSGLRRSVQGLLPDEVSPFVLVVDQFEELYTMTRDQERQAFTEALVDAITHPQSRLRIVITLRADFYDHPLATMGIGELLREHTELVTPMTHPELERAITRPAESVDVIVEPALLAALTADATAEPGVLPMLQYTLTELFDSRRGATMTAAAYESMGGLTRALVTRAESLFGALGPEGQAAAKQVFLRLVSLNEGGGDTRRRALLSELKSIEGTEGEVDDMLRAFARHRLLSFDRDPASRAPTVEIAHESLIGAWARLESWIDEARADIRARARLTTATADWIDEGKNPDYLLPGASLARYQTWVADPPVQLTSVERAFLEAAVEEEREKEKVARERQLQGSQLRRRTRALVGLGAMSVLVVGLALLAFGQRERARDLADELATTDEARQLVAESGLVLAEDPELAILLAVEAVRVTEVTGAALPEAVDALHWALQGASVQYPPDDTETAVAVRPHSTGARGVFALTPQHLVEMGQEAVARRFTPGECERYFVSDGCPDPMLPISDIDIAGGFERYTGLAREEERLAGTSVVVTGAWNGDMKEGAELELNRLTSELGVDVRYVAHRFDQDPNFVPLGEDPVDISIISAPGAIADIAASRPLIDVGAYLGNQYLRESYGEYLTSLASLAGRQHAVWTRLGAKSLLWYNASEFDRAGYVLPGDWADLMTLSDQMVADGKTPWCLGIFAFDSTGWPATDWLETVLLLEGGPEFYDRWVSHDVPFDHPAAVAALEKVGTLVHTPGYMMPRLIEETGWDEAWFLASQDPPQCWLTPAPDFAMSFFAEAPMSVVEFPRIDPDYSPAMLGAGDLALPVADRPEVRAVIRAIASPSWGSGWAQSPFLLDFTPPHRDFDVDLITDPLLNSISAAVSESVEADMFRFDGSDMMPYEIGFGPLLTELTDYVSSSGKSAQEALSAVEAAWNDYEAGQLAVEPG